MRSVVLVLSCGSAQPACLCSRIEEMMEKEAAAVPRCIVLSGASIYWGLSLKDTNGGSALNSPLKKVPFPCLRVKEEPCSFISCSSHPSVGLSPSWGSPCIWCLLSCADMSVWMAAVTCQRADMAEIWLGRNSMWGGAERPPRPRKFHPGWTWGSGCLDRTPHLLLSLSQRPTRESLPGCFPCLLHRAQLMDDECWMLTVPALAFPWAICSCALCASAKAFCSEPVSPETNLTQKLLIFCCPASPST